MGAFRGLCHYQLCYHEQHRCPGPGFLWGQLQAWRDWAAVYRMAIPGWSVFTCPAVEESLPCSRPSQDLLSLGSVTSAHLASSLLSPHASPEGGIRIRSGVSGPQRPPSRVARGPQAGMQGCTATWEDRVAVSYQMERTLTTSSSSLAPWYSST